MESAAVSLFCGLPGSGKTTLVNEIRHHCLFDSSDNMPEEYKLKISYNSMNVYVLSYDELIPIDGQKDIISSGVWKETRKEVICAAEAFICSTIGLPFSLTLSDTARMYLEKLFQSNKQQMKCTMHAFLIDDNFYYQSMRHEWYLLAKKLRMGFCQIYLECPPEIALSRNHSRRSAIPDNVINLMAERFEAPNHRKNQWEKNSLFINVKNTKNSFINQVMFIIEESLRNPIVHETDREIEKERAKKISSTNVIHQVDITLRNLTGEKVKKQAMDDKKFVKKYSIFLNEARRDILKSLKQGELSLPENLLEAVESGNYDSNELKETLSNILESPKYMKNVTS